MKIHEYGNKRGPVIVLIHAKYASAKYMEQYINSLKEHYHIIMPDMSGHGEDIRQYRSTKEDARELADWLVDKGYNHLRLVFGQSLGGQMAMYLVTTILPEIPLASIGQYFGGRDHTTVLHACERVSSLLQTDNQFRSRVFRAKDMIFG